MNSDFVGSRTDLISSAKQISSEHQRRFHRGKATISFFESLFLHKTDFQFTQSSCDGLHTRLRLGFYVKACNNQSRNDTMRFNTHDRTPRPEIKKSIKIIFAVILGLLFGVSLCLIVIACLSIDFILPIAIIATLIILLVIFLNDIQKEYIEIIDNKITVVNYNFNVKKEKNFLLSDIAYAEILITSSPRVRGKRINMAGISYIVFRDKNDKYMFKVLCTPESKHFFANYIKQQYH